MQCSILPNRECEDGARAGFREGDRSVKSFSDGFETRFRVYRAVTYVYFLVSGGIQRQPSQDHLQELSDALVGSIRETLAELSVEVFYSRRSPSLRSLAAATTRGSSMVASPTTVAFLASFSSFPHERASSSVAPDNPPV